MLKSQHKTEVQLWFYKAEGNFYDKLIRLVNRTKYSHVEMFIDGYCYSSSPRDRGVRRKYISLNNQHWDVLSLEVTAEHKQYMLKFFEEQQGKAYDWFGAIKTTLWFFPNHKDKWFCSELLAQALNLPYPRKWTPADLYDFFKTRIDFTNKGAEYDY